MAEVSKASNGFRTSRILTAAAPSSELPALRLERLLPKSTKLEPSSPRLSQHCWCRPDRIPLVERRLNAHRTLKWIRHFSVVQTWITVFGAVILRSFGLLVCALGWCLSYVINNKLCPDFGLSKK